MNSSNDLNLTNRHPSPWYIVGHGAIGLLWAKHLAEHHQVKLILRPTSHQLGNTSSDIYHYTTVNNQRQQRQINIAKLDQHTAIEKLLIPTKAYDIEPALKQLQPMLAPNCTILLCHNGMGTIEAVKQWLKPTQSLYFATTTHGAYKPARHDVIHTGCGETKIGKIQGPDTLAKEQGLLSPIQWQQNIETTLWSKLAINCAINPLTAIHNCKNGELNQPQYQKLITSICEEFATVANLNGQHFDPQQLIQQCRTVIEATANNYSSMHQDIHHGRASEIDYITGFIIQQAQKLNLSVPTHQLIYRQIHRVAAHNKQRQQQ